MGELIVCLAPSASNRISGQRIVVTVLLSGKKIL